MRLTVILFTLIDDTSQCYFVMEIMNLSSDKDDYYFSVAHPFISKRSMASLFLWVIQGVFLHFKNLDLFMLLSFLTLRIHPLFLVDYKPIVSERNDSK